MNKALRKAIIAGNWKMNKTPAEAAALASSIKSLAAQRDCQVVLAVPFVDLAAVGEAIKDSGIYLGAQNCHWASNGAFTGEISPQMLVECGVSHVILGHSERRQYFGETDETVNRRLLAALEAGLHVILCVGEQLSQREQGITREICAMQVKIALGGVTREQMERVVIAYEPVWAIGTGKTATAAQADEVCGAIRQVVEELYDSSVAQALTIQYGGSMNAGNAQELLDQPNVDGGLIGGASLKGEDFAKIIAAASR